MTSPGASDICFITTCRGRLAHLQQSLPRWAALPGASGVVVDYGCPDGAGDWVAANHPPVKVVRVDGAPHFEVAKARNLGAAAADAPWLCFVDADMLLPADFIDRVRAQRRPRHYLTLHPRRLNTFGLCVCHRDDFAAVEGYDEVLQGWGMDDKDFYTRLRLAGVQEGALSSEGVVSIEHGDELRVAHYADANRGRTSEQNFIYCAMKWDLIRLHGRPLALARRRALYEQVVRQFGLAPAGSMTFELPISRHRTVTDGLLEGSLTYRISHPR